MRIDIATLFPEMVDGILSESIVGRARKKVAIEISCHQIRDYTLDKHRRVHDIPYGSGMGMVMQTDPIYRCYLAVCEQTGVKPHTIYMTPKGRVFTQSRAAELSKLKNILIICGHYEGVDSRVIDEIVDEEISVGDYVLTGGELPALVLVDCVVRMLEGTLSQADCYEDESHYNGLLEYPQYTRPEVWHDREVPIVLLSGNHAEIAKWRREEAVKATYLKRPELLERSPLTEKDLAIIHKLEEKENKK